MVSLRSGAALILALILVTALLLLGLPFIFSQATSLSGTRAFAAQRLAGVGRENAQNLAAALASYAMTPSLQASPTASIPGPQWSSLPVVFASAQTPLRIAQSVQELGLNGGYDACDGSIGVWPFQLKLGLNALPTPAGTSTPGTLHSYIGAAISDESGKLDPNTMSVALWQALLSCCHITDWPDCLIYPTPVAPYPPGTYVPSPDTYGELAKSLAGLRFSLPGARIRSLEQLLLANIQVQQPGSSKDRGPLTRAELERLRPYLSLHGGRPGRSGLIDLGTVIASDKVATSQTVTYWTDSMPDVLQSLLANGTVIDSETQLPTGEHALAKVTSIPQYAPQGSVDSVMWGYWINAQGTITFANPGQALMLEAPPVVNIHQLSPVVREALSFASTIPVSLPISPPPPIQPYNFAIFPALPPAYNGSAQFPAPIPRPLQTTPSAPVDAIVPDIGALWNVLGQPASDGSLTAFNLSNYISPTSSGNELPPLGIMSSGMFSIDSACTITDLLNQQIAQEQRRQVMQAVPQEYLQERRWQTQGDLYALTTQRWGSRVQSWPVALERFFQNGGPPPDDQDLNNPSATASAISPLTSIRPRQLPDFSLASLSGSIPNPIQSQQIQQPLEQIYVDWQVGFGFDLNRRLTTMCRAYTPNGGFSNPVTTMFHSSKAAFPDLASVLPDGIMHSSDVDLEYGLASQTAASPIVSAMLLPRVKSPPNPTVPPTEIGARQISLWLKAASPWTSGVYLILEAKMPTANAGTPMNSPVGGDPNSQNYFGFFYDATNHLLVLALAPPSIEYSPTAYPILADPYDPVDQLSDHMCRSHSGALPLAPGPYADSGTGLKKFTGVFQPNRILHCYYVPDYNGLPYFQPNQWVHLQIAIASDRPEGVTIMVDGIVGQDVAHTATHALQNMGDHVTLPAVFLNQPLAYMDPTPIGLNSANYSPFIIPSLPVSTVPGLSASSMLPARGIVRIDDEYIRYESISPSGDALINCTRGWRQDTWSNFPQPTFQDLPSTQSHAVNSTVTPGGYHLTWPIPTGTTGTNENLAHFYRGGCTLAQAFGTGDTNAYLPNRGSIWAWAGGSTPTVTVTALSNSYTVPYDTMVSSPYASKFPANGVVAFVVNANYMFFFYTLQSSGVMVLTAIPSTQVFPAGTPNFNCPSIAPGQQITYTPGSDFFMLASIAVSGPDPTQAGRYPQIPAPNERMILAIQDGDLGRLEWVRYDCIVDNAPPSSGGFFINTLGFEVGGSVQTRGLYRTDYDPTVDFTINPSSPSLVLPVHTEFTGTGHWFNTGDVVTFIPKVQSDPTRVHLPFQMMVRYGATDGFPFASAPVPPLADSHNDYFSFTSSFPDPPLSPTPISDLPGPAPLAEGLTAYNWDVLCGNCWSGFDLSPLVPPGQPNMPPTIEPRGQLPRLDAWSTAYGVASPAPVIDAVIAIGGYVGANVPGSDATIDDVCAGGLTASAGQPDGHDYAGPLSNPASPVNALPSAVQLFWSITSGSALPKCILTSVDDLVTTDVIVQSTTPLFDDQSGTFGLNMGLIDIDGEVFAYQRPSANDGLAIQNSSASLFASYPGMVSGVSYLQASVQSSGYFARLVARHLLNDTPSPHDLVIGSGVFGDGPFLRDQNMHCPLLPAMRLPLGPVRQLADTPIETASNGTYNWFGLRDLSELYPAGPSPSSPPLATVFNAPAALVYAANGSSLEMLQLIGPKQNDQTLITGTSTKADVNFNKYTTAAWLRGTYNTKSKVATEWQATDPRPILIGWWPRYPSAMPHLSQNPFPSQSLRSRSFPWIGFPYTVLGGYFDAARQSLLPDPFKALPIAEVTYTADPEFTVEMRALANNAVWDGAPSNMDWWSQTAVTSASSDASAVFLPSNDGSRSLSDGTTVNPVDGAELRVSWRYATKPSSQLLDLAAAGNRAISLSSVRLRCLAPIRSVAIEGSH